MRSTTAFSFALTCSHDGPSRGACAYMGQAGTMHGHARMTALRALSMQDKGFPPDVPLVISMARKYKNRY